MREMELWRDKVSHGWWPLKTGLQMSFADSTAYTRSNSEFSKRFFFWFLH